ncbi:hypothetical protein CBL_05279 [Carabus blaptoides fortunei]
MARVELWAQIALADNKVYRVRSYGTRQKLPASRLARMLCWNAYKTGVTAHSSHQLAKFRSSWRSSWISLSTGKLGIVLGLRETCEHLPRNPAAIPSYMLETYSYGVHVRLCSSPGQCVALLKPPSGQKERRNKKLATMENANVLFSYAELGVRIMARWNCAFHLATPLLPRACAYS